MPHATPQNKPPLRPDQIRCTREQCEMMRKQLEDANRELGMRRYNAEFPLSFFVREMEHVNKRMQLEIVRLNEVVANYAEQLADMFATPEDRAACRGIESVFEDAYRHHEIQKQEMEKVAAMKKKFTGKRKPGQPGTRKRKAKR